MSDTEKDEISTLCRMVYVTFPDRDTAERIGRMLVERRLAACANLLGSIHSVYRWEGAVCEADEVGVLIKTSSSVYPELERVLVEAHPYDTPCVVSWELSRGHPAFLDWIHRETGPEAEQ